MNSNYAYNGNIMKSINNIIEHSLSKHSRVMSVRFDLRFPNSYTGDTSNTYISRCMARIVQTLSRNNIDSSYIWAREQETSKHPHYHCAVLIDGHKSQNEFRVLKIAEKQWKQVIQSNIDGLTHHCRVAKNNTPQENGIMIRKDRDDYEEKVDKVVKQLSYLGKSAGKGTPLDGVRDFGTSRLKNK